LSHQCIRIPPFAGEREPLGDSANPALKLPFLVRSVGLRACPFRPKTHDLRAAYSWEWRVLAVRACTSGGCASQRDRNRILPQRCDPSGGPSWQRLLL